ncbi:MAG: sigma-70 family RNA polymerase sigma factor [Phycisphaerales bacterium]
MPRAILTSLTPPQVQRILQSPESAPPSDALARDLTARMAAGDTQALARVFALRCTLVEREAARALGHRADLMPDAAQEAWLRVARTPAPCADAGALDAWLRRVAVNAAIDLLRSELARRARERRFARERPQAERFIADALQLERAQDALRALDGLGSEERALLELRARTGATLAQLGRALGLGPAAIDSRLRRAAQRARDLLEGSAP